MKTFGNQLKKPFTVAAFLVFAAVSLARADFVTDTIPAGTNPFAVAVNPVTNRTYVANYGSGTVTVINGEISDTIATITVGSNPRAVAVNALTNKIYVANFTATSVSVIDGATNTVTATVTVQSNPNAIAINPATNKIYVTNYASASVSVINGSSNAVDATIPVGSGPMAVCVNPVTNKIYVANSGSNSVTVINGVTNNTANVTVGTNPSSVAANTVTNKIYIANQGSNNVSVIDGATNGTSAITVGTSPSAIAVNLVTDKVYVVNSGSNSMTVIDGATGTAVAAVTVGTNPTATAINTTMNKIYVANYGSNSVSVITGDSLTGTLIVGTNPNAVAVNTITNKIYTANNGSGNVTVVDGATNQISVLSNSFSFFNGNCIAVNPVTNKIYSVFGTRAWVSGSMMSAIYRGSVIVAVIDGITNQPVDTIVLFSATGYLGDFQGPYIERSSISVNPVTNKIHVSFTSMYTPPVNGLYNDSVWIDGNTNSITGADNISVPQLNRATNANPVTNKTWVVNSMSSFSINTPVNVIDNTTGIKDTVTMLESRKTVMDTIRAVVVNPVTNKVCIANYNYGITMIDEAPVSDTKLRVIFDNLPYTGFYNTTFLAQPVITGKAVNRLRFGHTGISRVGISKTTARTSWNNASITNGAGTDSASWSWVWSTDTLLFGENLLCAVALDSETTSTDNPGLGTPFAGNVTIFPIYRLSPPPAFPPVLISPGNNTVGQPLSQTFMWGSVSGATFYTLQVSGDSLFTTFVFNGTVNGDSKNVGSLANNTTYFWRVNAGNPSGTSDWSSVWKFTTSVVDAPVLSSPANNAVDILTNSLFAWNTVNGATSYSVQISTDSTFSTTAVNQSSITATDYQASGLSINTVYCWRVNASNVAGTGPWSHIWRFTTVSTPPDSAVLTSPANGAINISIKPTLFWLAAARAGSYVVQVSTASDFSSQVVNDSSITNTSHIANGLSAYTFYYWRVKAENAVGESSWSEVWNFMTGPAAPSAPALVSPANGALNQPVSLSFVWNSISAATSYHVQVATDSIFTGIVTEDSTLTDTVKSDTVLAFSATYYWRVRAKNAGGASAWSQVRSFTTIPTAVLPRPYSIPSVFSISGSSGIIRCSLASACHVSLKYYDLRGRLIATLVNTTQGAGYYMLSIKSILPSRGTYIRVFEAGVFVKRELVAMVGK